MKILPFQGKQKRGKIHEGRKEGLGYSVLGTSLSSRPTPSHKKCHRRVRNLALEWTVWFHLRDLFPERYGELCCRLWKLDKIQARHHCLWSQSLQSARSIGKESDLTGPSSNWQSSSTLLEAPLTNDANEHTAMLPTTSEIDQILIRHSASLLKIVVWSFSSAIHQEQKKSPSKSHTAKRSSALLSSISMSVSWTPVLVT